MAVILWGSNNLVTVSCTYSKAGIGSGTRRWIGGCYSAANDFHSVQVDFMAGSVKLVQWKSASGDQTSGSKTIVYVR